jgi:hypothetical protein
MPEAQRDSSLRVLGKRPELELLEARANRSATSVSSCSRAAADKWLVRAYA